MPAPILLSGPNAFYNQPEYLKTTYEELCSKSALPPIYHWNSEKKTSRIFWFIVNCCIFPIGVYKTLHAAMGKFGGIIPSSTPCLTGKTAEKIQLLRQKIDLNSQLKYKRFSISVNGERIDGMIIGKPQTFDNGRWLLETLGSGSYYEERLANDSKNIEEFLDKTKSNAIIYNFSGVIGSVGLPTRDTNSKCYQAMLSFLESKENGIGAKEIIGAGSGFGAGVQADALLAHNLKENIKYTFIKQDAYSNLADVVRELFGFIASWVIRLLNWNISTSQSSLQLKAPELIIQHANVTEYKIINSINNLKGNGIIPSTASASYFLLKNIHQFKDKRKIFIGSPLTQQKSMTYFPLLANLVNISLK